jgi:hypothetical protein
MKVLAPISLICLVLSTALSGCISTESVSAAQVRDSAVATSLDITSYEFLLDMSMNMETNLYGDDSTMSISTNGNGIVDLVNQNLMMEINYGSSGVIQIEASYLFYLIDYVMYMKMDFQDTQSWYKMDFSQLDNFLDIYNTYWDTYDQMQSLATLLEVSEVKFINDQTIFNVDCYGLELIPDINMLVDALATQFGSSASMLQGMDLSNFVDSFIIQLWIAKETNFIMKAYEYMKVTMQSPTQMTMRITVLMNNYNNADSIVLPEEAEDAVDMTDYGSQIPY